MAKKFFKKSGKNDQEKDFEQKIIDLARVTRVMAGGKRMRFRACVAIGDKKGSIAFSVAKGADVSIAINKAVSKAKKNLFKVQIVKNTIAHSVNMKYKAAKVLIKPAPEGTGIKAGGAMRIIFELAGIPNIVGKIMGSNNKINIVTATVEALKDLRVVEVKEKKTEKKEVDKKDTDKEKIKESVKASVSSKSTADKTVEKKAEKIKDKKK